MSRRRNSKTFNRAKSIPITPGGGLSYVPAGQKQGISGTAFYGGKANIPVGQSAIFSPGIPLQPQQGVNPGGYPVRFPFAPASNTFPVDRSMGQQDIPSFQQLRMLAKLYNGITLCERAWSDLVPRMKLKIELKPEYISAGANSKDYQTDIAYFMNWFESPDKIHDLHSWLRIALREQTQIDELYIYKRKNRGGGLHSLEIVAGDQMKPLLDDWGKIPLPPNSAYQQYPWGLPGQWFTANELIHYQETPAADSPYGQSRVERIIMLVNQALRKQKKDLSHFTEGNIPQGIMRVPKDAVWTPDQIDTFEQAWNALLAGNSQQQVRIRFTQPGMEYQPFEQYTLDPTFDKFILNIAVSSYGMSMQDLAFTEDIHKSSSDSQQNVTYRRTIDPLAVIYAGILTNIMNNDFPSELNGEMLVATFGGYDEEEDISTLADTYTKLTAAGILGITNAGALMKLPDDPNSPYIGRVIMNANGPVFLDDVSTDKVRAAQVQAQLAQYQNIGQEPSPLGGQTQDPNQAANQVARVFTGFGDVVGDGFDSNIDRHMPTVTTEGAENLNEKDLKKHEAKYPLKENLPKAEGSIASKASANTKVQPNAGTTTSIHIHAPGASVENEGTEKGAGAGVNTSPDDENVDQEAEEEIDATDDENDDDEEVANESEGFDEGEDEEDEDEEDEDPLDALIYPDMPEEEIDQLIEQPEDTQQEILIQDLLEQDKDEPYSELERSYEGLFYRHYPGGRAHNQKLHGDWAHPGYGAVHDKAAKGRRINSAQVSIKSAEKKLASAVTSQQKKQAEQQLASAKAELKVATMHKSNTNSAEKLAKAQARTSALRQKGAVSAAKGASKLASIEARTAKIKAEGAAQHTKAENKLASIQSKTNATNVKSAASSAKAQAKIARIQAAEQRKLAAIKAHIVSMQLKALKARIRFQKIQASATKTASAAKAKTATMGQHAAHAGALAATRAARASTQAQKSATKSALAQAKQNAKDAKTLHNIVTTLSSKISVYAALAGRRISKTWTEKEGMDAHQIALDMKELLSAINSHTNMHDASGLLADLQQSLNDLKSNRVATKYGVAPTTVLDKLIGQIGSQLMLNRSVNTMLEEEDIYDEEENETIESEADAITDQNAISGEKRYTISELLDYLQEQIRREKGQQQQQQQVKSRSISDDYRNWRQRAIEDVKSGRVQRGFTTVLIPEYMHTFIQEELKRCLTVEDVKSVFERARKEKEESEVGEALETAP